MDIVTGLDVLHNHKYVHRDLAARNCLVTSDLTVKIGDYGLAEEKFPVDYFKWQNYMFPIRWMAPE
uniref:Protein kinase domain-containing protein n=1 Tax=Helobdella robusta TaxID=6412 RepID=T1EIS6_HELRO